MIAERLFPFLLLGSATLSTQGALIVIDPNNVTASSELTPVSPSFNRQNNFIVDGSGLAGGQHGIVPDDFMWLSSGSGFGGIDPDPRVTFDLGAVYLISQIQVWNYNENSPPNLTSRGVDQVSINFGVTPALGSSVPGITNFAQASGATTYTGEVFNSFTPFSAR